LGAINAVPIDAKIAQDSDVAAEALRISDYARPLAALKLKASIVVLDAARANLFARSGPPLAGGLALVEAEPGLLIAFNGCGHCGTGGAMSLWRGRDDSRRRPRKLSIFGQPVLIFDDPVFAFAPPPPTPIVFLAPPPEPMYV
jgi:hypothetical protein